MRLLSQSRRLRHGTEVQKRHGGRGHLFGAAIGVAVELLQQARHVKARQWSGAERGRSRAGAEPCKDVGITCSGFGLRGLDAYHRHLGLRARVEADFANVGTAIDDAVAITKCYAIEKVFAREFVDAVADTFFGVEFVDDYRWLEDQAAPETRSWIDAARIRAPR